MIDDGDIVFFCLTISNAFGIMQYIKLKGGEINGRRCINKEIEEGT